MSDLRLPLDFERTHEFRLLVNALKSKAVVGANLPEKSFDASAVFIYLRLFVELAFLARTTNRPGYLTQSGKTLFESTLEPMFGADCHAADLLHESGILETAQGADGEMYCPVFAQLNAHCAGNYVGKEKRGNIASLYERRKHTTAQEALQQALMLDKEIFRKREGGVMTDSEINRAMVLIKTLDNALGYARPIKHYTEALVADAFEVSAKYAREPEILRSMFIWIMTNRTEPALPKTTEQILTQFETIEGMTRQ